jgi:hypothetical protein
MSEEKAEEEDEEASRGAGAMTICESPMSARRVECSMSVCRAAHLIGVLGVVAMLLIIATSAQAAQAGGPVWKILSVSTPTNFEPGDETGDDAIVVTATNVGDTAADGNVAPVTISDQLPVGLEAVAVTGVNMYEVPLEFNLAPEETPPYGFNCTLSTSAPACSTSESVDPGDTLIVTIKVHVKSALPSPLPKCEVPAGATGCVMNEASVSGGGATRDATSDPVTISSAPPPYGFARGGVLAAVSTDQAGAHPNVTSEFFLNTINETTNGHTLAIPVNLPRDVRFDLPAGLAGTTVGMARCTMAAVVAQADCPQNTMVGTATVMFDAENQRIIVTVPVYNIAPSAGEPAAFAFNALFYPVRLDTSVLSDGEYNVRVTAPSLSQGAPTYMSSVTIWGVPAEHNSPGPDHASRTLRGAGFIQSGRPQVTFGSPGTETYTGNNSYEETVLEQRVPLLSNATQCSTPLTALVESDPWEGLQAGSYSTEPVSMGIATGCSKLSFDPSVSILPDTLEAGEPAGYTFHLSVAQNNEVEALSPPDVKRTAVTLPAGTVLSPSAANGLGDCTSEQFELHSGAPGGCPADSQIGVVHIKSPDLEETLNGEAYLAAPECEPCTPQDASEGKMVRLFVQVVGEDEDGVVVKLEGTGHIDQADGQITTIFEDTPQLPFSEFQLVLDGGETAPLANPRTCGTSLTTADLTPWSTPYTPDATISSAFEISRGLGGGGCGAAPQFNPTFTAGTTSNQAGSFSPATLIFGRADSDEYLGGLQLTAPPGLLGKISSVTECPEPEASNGNCPSSSQVGEVTTEVGPGTDPYIVTGGEAYLTGSYKGAPYGASIVIPTKAGPYTLAGNTGNGTDVVRAAVTINPETGQFTVTTDPFPTQLDGIPLQIRQITTTLGTSDNFTFNPTSCEKLTFTGTLVSVGAASANRSSSFQDANCAALRFKPSFTVSTTGTASKANGASLTVKITTKQGPDTKEGEREANIRKVDVQLPIDLPSRLSTLQQACTSQQFAANPAGCPEGSFVGTAIAHTPVLNAPLTGPAILVSHAGAAFPDLDLILQGEGVVVRLVGNTDIKKGVTYSKFEAAPDAPISSFELNLPEGHHSILGAYIPTGGYSFCGLKKVATTTKKETKQVNGKTEKVSVKVKISKPATLEMPTIITAQDGTVLKQTTKIAVTGCPSATAAKKRATAAKKVGNARRSRDGRGARS